MRCIKAILVLLSCCCIRQAVAQQLAITAYNPDNGVLSSGANSLLQDRYGWIWLSTGYDVVKYDGHEFKSYPPKQSVEMDFVFKVLEVGDEIWALTDPQILKVNGDSLGVLQLQDTIDDVSASITIDKTIYILADGGLFEYKNNRVLPLLTHPGLHFHHDESLFHFENYIVSYIWHEQLLIFDLHKQKLYQFPWRITDAANHKDGKLYFLLQDSGIVELESLKNWDHLSAPVLKPIIRFDEPKADVVTIDDEGQFWIGVHETYLKKINSDRTTTLYGENDGLPGLWFYDILTDREGNVWMGFNSGVAKIANTPAIRFTRSQGLLSNHTAFIFQPNHLDEIWAGTYNGINRLTSNSIRPLLSGNQKVTCKHMIFAEGQYYFLNENSLYTTFFVSNVDALSAPKLLTAIPGTSLFLASDTHGTIFIATNQGLYAWNGKLTSLSDHPEHYHCIYIDDTNRLWAGSFAGPLQVYHIEYVGNTPSLKSISEKSLVDLQDLIQIRCMAVDSKDRLLVGTRYNGLFRISFEKNKISHLDVFKTDQDLLSPSIWGLSCDANGNSWIATAKGLNQLHPDDRITDEGSAAGIHQAATVFADGSNQIWVASHPGIVNIRHRPQGAVPFVAEITELRINGEVLPPATKILRLPHTQNQVSISFSANTYTDESSAKYTYRLLRNRFGEWSAPTSLHTIQYSALRPGKYEFEVMADNNAGIRSVRSANLSFQILPPFWLQPWFLFLCIASITLAIYSLYRFRIRQLMKLQIIRNNISKDLHDDIGASLSNIHILTTLAQRHQHEPAKASDYLNQAGEDIQHISESLSDIVWNINPQNDDLDHLLSRMKRYAADMLEGSAIEANIDFPAQTSHRQFSMEKRRDFFLIFKETIHNIVKHSGATTAWITIQDLTHALRMSIRDDGIGFDPSDMREGNGLHNMKVRALQSGAFLDIQSTPGEGTLVSLEMKH